MHREGSVLIVVDSGLEMFDLGIIALNTDGMPTNLMPGTEYAILDGDQTVAYIAGEVNFVPRKDTPEKVGAFALEFSAPERVVRSQTMMS